MGTLELSRVDLVAIQLDVSGLELAHERKEPGNKGRVKVFDRKPVPKNSPLQDARRTASGHKIVKYDLAKMIESTFL